MSIFKRASKKDTRTRSTETSSGPISESSQPTAPDADLAELLELEEQSKKAAEGKKGKKAQQARDTGFWGRFFNKKNKKGELCPDCGTPLVGGWCPACGSDERPATCPACGAELHGKFCAECGTNVAEHVAAAKAAPKKRAKAAKKEIERVIGTKAAETTNEVAGLQLLYPDGMALNDDGRFSVTMEFGDVSYEHERKDVRDDIYDKNCLLHASFPPPMGYQINLVNFPVHMKGANRYLEEVGPTADVARAYNETIRERQRKGQTLFDRRNFITLSIPAEDADIAANRLATAMEATAAHFNAMKCPARPLTAMERAHVFHDLLRGINEPCFLDERRLAKGERVRDYLAPSWMVYEESEAKLRRTLTLPGRVVKSFVIRDFGSDLSDRAIRTIRALPIPMNISLYSEPQPHPAMMERINQNIDIVQGQMFNLQSRIVKQGGDPTVLPPAVEDREADARDLRNFMRDEDQDIAWFQGIITIFAEDEEHMSKYVDMLADQVAIWSLDAWNIPQYQEDCLTSSLPLAQPKLGNVFRSLCTAERAAMIPFSSINISNDPAKSYYLGVERVTRGDIFINPDELMSPHMWVFGPTGSGKSMELKFMLDYTMLHNPRTRYDAKTGEHTVVNKDAPQWFIYDFHNEYGDITGRHGGAASKFGPGHDSCLNPLDISSAEGVLTLKDVNSNIDFFIALIEAILGRRMTSREQSELDECLIKTYEPFLGTDERPTLVDLQRALQEGGNAVAGEIASSIKMYVTGTMSSFAKQTNVHTDPWINRFDMSELGSTMQTIGMLATLQHVRMAAYKNNREGRTTYLLIEEVQKLFANDAAVSVFISFFAEMRKYGLHIICVTQLPKAVLEHPMVSDLFDNSSLFVFLPQQEQEVSLIANLFKLSETQAGYISATAEKGTGLIIADGIKVGFDNRIPENSLLYKIHNTDPGKAAREDALNAGPGSGSVAGAASWSVMKDDGKNLNPFASAGADDLDGGPAEVAADPGRDGDDAVAEPVVCHEDDGSSEGGLPEPAPESDPEAGKQAANQAALPDEEASGDESQGALEAKEPEEASSQAEAEAKESLEASEQGELGSKQDLEASNDGARVNPGMKQDPERGALNLNAFKKAPAPRGDDVFAYLDENPGASVNEVANALGISWATAKKWAARHAEQVR